MQWQLGEFVITIGKFDDLNLNLRGWVGWGRAMGEGVFIKNNVEAKASGTFAFLEVTCAWK